MKLIAWLLAGALALGLARVLRPSEDPYALAPTIVAGIIGAVLGGAVASLMGGDDVTVGARTVLLASIGAMVLMGGYRYTRRDD